VKIVYAINYLVSANISAAAILMRLLAQLLKLHNTRYTVPSVNALRRVIMQTIGE